MAAHRGFGWGWLLIEGLAGVGWLGFVASCRKLETKQRALSRLEDQLHKLETQATDKVCLSLSPPLPGFTLHAPPPPPPLTPPVHCMQQENKEIALGTSKLNYLDPRISVAWCKKWDVPVEKIYNKTQRQKFAWAMDMADEHFEF